MDVAVAEYQVGQSILVQYQNGGPHHERVIAAVLRHPMYMVLSEGYELFPMTLSVPPLTAIVSLEVTRDVPARDLRLLNEDHTVDGFFSREQMEWALAGGSRLAAERRSILDDSRVCVMADHHPTIRVG